MTTHFDLKFISTGKIDTILPLYKIMDDKLSESLAKERLAELLTGDYKIVAVYPQDSNKPVGMMGLSYGMRVYCGSYIELHHMVVDPEWRGTGAAKKLVKYAESYARIRDVDGLTLDSYFHAEEAHDLYEKSGYIAIGKHFVKDL